METKDEREKLNGILRALAAGRTCEEILTEDRTLSFRDIFHAVAEAPTSYWDRASARNAGDEAQRVPDPIPTPLRHRTD